MEIITHRSVGLHNEYVIGKTGFDGINLLLSQNWKKTYDNKETLCQ